MRILWTAALAVLTVLPGAVPAQELTLHLIGNAHIDLAYRWRWNETVLRVAPDTFEGVLDLMESDPDVTYAQSQLALYEEIEMGRPDLFERIRSRIDEGRWSVVGGQWAEPDAILPGGESLIRQFLIGSEYSRRRLGLDPTAIAWVPDSFCGQAVTLPQIYAGCGIRYYLFGRGAPGDFRIFWWEAPDGSRLLACKVPIHYNLRLGEALLPGLREWSRLAGVTDVPVLYGEGDHGGGPRRADIEAIEQLRAKQDLNIELVHQTPESYFERLAASVRDLPVYRGEMGIGAGESEAVRGSWRGSYTSQARLKKANRDMENLLLTAETFATLGAMLQRKPLYPRVDFREAWKVLLRNQFHDILPGTSIGDVFDDAMADLSAVRDEGERLLRFGLEVIGSRIDTRGSGLPVVVYNPCSWERTDVVEAAINFVVEPDRFTVCGPDLAEVPFQIDGWSDDGLTAYISFLAEAVPPVGYRLYRIHLQPPSTPETGLSMQKSFMVNRYYKVSWNNRGLTSIYDKRGGRELLAAPGNVTLLLGEKRSSSWDLELSGESQSLTRLGEPQVFEQGPVRSTLFWQEHTGSSLVTRELTLKAGVPRVEFRMTLDWHDHDQVLKVTFPVAIDSGRALRAFFEQPFGVIERPADGTEWPAQNWIDLCGGEFGVALLNDGKYGFDVRGSTLRLSVVRGARDMDPRMDEGVHAFRYALFAHPGDWREGDVVQAALELNRPLMALQENFHSGELPNWGDGRINEFSLPAEHSFFSVESGHVIVSAIKVQQGDWSPANVVLRLFETEGRSGQAVVHLPAAAKRVVETNHIEQELPLAGDWSIKEDVLTVTMDPHKIRTFLLTL